MKERNGDYTGTFTGKRFHPLDPRPEDICLDDIAHALSNICRFNGHTKYFYSIAAHCINVYRYLFQRGLGQRICILGILHDASEAYICDIPRPFKPYLAGYRKIEENIMQAIYEHFGIEPPTFAEAQDIKEADDYVLSLEAKHLMSNTEGWNLVDSDPREHLIPHTSTTEFEFKAKIKAWQNMRLAVSQIF